MRFTGEISAGSGEDNMIGEVFCAGGLLLVIWLWRYTRGRQIQLPGPKGLPVIGVSHLMNPVHKVHVIITEWNRQYGPCIHVPLLSGQAVAVSGFDAIYEVTVKKGYAFGGRVNYFRSDATTSKTGILRSRETDDTWKLLRKITHRHLKQFGDGMSRLENVITEVGEDMFKEFERNSGKPFDPSAVIFDTALNSIAFLIMGERTRSGDAIIEKMRHYEDRFLQVLAPVAKLNHLLIDFAPWIRFLGVEIWRMIQDFVEFESGIWRDIKELNAANPGAISLCKTLMENVGGESGDSSGSDVSHISEIDAQITSMNLLLAGVTTTSNTFYAAVNILAHCQDIQNAILREIRAFFPEGEPVTLDKRPSMHYCRAFLLELLRYTSVLSLSVSHRAVHDETIQGHRVPKDTRIFVNIYGLHHDAEFWKDPEIIRPERYLDDAGELLPADHPNRKHTMPFGAGPRVCVGETLAMMRLFIWVTTLVNRFRVDPSDDNDPSSLDPRNSYFVAVLRPTPYKVVFSQR